MRDLLDCVTVIVDKTITTGDYLPYVRYGSIFLVGYVDFH